MGLFDNLKKVGEQALKDITSDEAKAKAKSILNAAGEMIGDAAEAGKKKFDELNTEENRAKLKGIINDAGKKLGETAQNAKNYVNSAINEDKNPSDLGNTAAAAADESELSCEEKILNVLANEFPQYTVAKDVSPKALGGSGKFMNYSILVCSGKEIKLAIMLIGKTTCSHREYRFSKEYAENHGFTMINFIKHYPNELKYISERLHKYL